MTIYFDNAATTFPKPKVVVDAVNNCMSHGAVNAGRGVYPLAHQADKVISETRSLVADSLDFKGGHVVFSPSASIAINQVLLGMKWTNGDVIYVTPLEHNSVTRVVEQIRLIYNVEIIEIPLCPKTFNYNREKLKEMFFMKPPKAVVMTHVSNVIGLITPVKDIATLAKTYDAVVVVDGCQAGPILPIDSPQGVIDFYIFSGHKTFYGPFGIGGFVTSGRVELNPLLFGGTGSHSEEVSMPEEYPYRFEVGSPNIVAITGLNQACKWVKETGAQTIRHHEQNLFNWAVEGFGEYDGLKLYINTEHNNHLGILSFTIDGYTSQEIGMILSQEFNIATRAGLHCAPSAHRFLGTMPNGTVRIGFGYSNTRAELEVLIEAVERILNT